MANVLDYYDEETYLAHHGIKGQKWGVRRFQNPDGTLTAEGRSRYNSDSAGSTEKSLNRIDKENAKLTTKAAIEEMKGQKAYNWHRDRKAQVHYDTAESIRNSIAEGEKIRNKLLSEANEKGYRVQEIGKTRYTHTGRMILASLLTTPAIGTLSVAAIDVHRARKYGSEAGGVVYGTKYNVSRK